MSALQLACFLLTALTGTAVVLTRDPRRQVMVVALYGLVLTILFMVLQAPDVAFSELAVGAAALPLMLLVTLAGTSRRRRPDEAEDDQDHQPARKSRGK
jgi:energy-converting hydrogenase B subunit D